MFISGIPFFSFPLRLPFLQFSYSTMFSIGNNTHIGPVRPSAMVDDTLQNAVTKANNGADTVKIDINRASNGGFGVRDGQYGNLGLLGVQCDDFRRDQLVNV